MIRPFISKIQQSDEATKKRWLIILSTVASLIAVGLWVLNLTVIFGRGQAPEVAQSTRLEDEAPSSWDTFTSSIYGATQDFRNVMSESMKSLKESVNTPREVNVQVQ